MFRRLAALIGVLVLGLALSACDLTGGSPPENAEETSKPGTVTFRFFARYVDGNTVTPNPTGHVRASVIGNDGLEQQWRDNSDDYHDGPRVYDFALPLEHVVDWTSQSRTGTVTVQVDSLPEDAYLECTVIDEAGEVPSSHKEAGPTLPAAPVELTCTYDGRE